MSRVLVTGGTGFVGRHVVPLLAERGHEVHVVSSQADVPPEGAAELHQADLLDPGAAAAIIRASYPSHLLHLAWDVKPPGYLNRPDNARWTEASLRLIREFADGGGNRAVLAGTCFEYDLSYGFCSEALTPLRPASLYGTCKAALQATADALAPELDLSLAWGRIFFAYGPAEHPSRLVPAVIRALLADEPAAVSHGRQVRDYLHATDIASAFVALLESDVRGAVNVGSGRPVTLREIVTWIGDALGRTDLLRFGEVDSPPDEPPLVVADTRRLCAEVGWEPALTLDDGLGRCIEWWRRQASER